MSQTLKTGLVYLLIDILLIVVLVYQTTFRVTDDTPNASYSSNLRIKKEQSDTSFSNNQHLFTRNFREDE